MAKAIYFALGKLFLFLDSLMHSLIEQNFFSLKVELVQL